MSERSDLYLESTSTLEFNFSSATETWGSSPELVDALWSGIGESSPRFFPSEPATPEHAELLASTEVCPSLTPYDIEWMEKLIEVPRSKCTCFEVSDPVMKSTLYGYLVRQPNHLTRQVPIRIFGITFQTKYLKKLRAVVFQQGRPWIDVVNATQLFIDFIPQSGLEGLRRLKRALGTQHWIGIRGGQDLRGTWIHLQTAQKLVWEYPGLYDTIGILLENQLQLSKFDVAKKAILKKK